MFVSTPIATLRRLAAEEEAAANAPGLEPYERMQRQNFAAGYRAAIDLELENRRRAVIEYAPPPAARFPSALQWIVYGLGWLALACAIAAFVIRSHR